LKSATKPASAEINDYPDYSAIRESVLRSTWNPPFREKDLLVILIIESKNNNRIFAHTNTLKHPEPYYGEIDVGCTL
jgi:hypothetical protein